MKVLILGERGGEHPWSGGPSSRRLWRWFGFTRYEELADFATPMNVHTKKGTYETNPEYWNKLRNAIVEHDVVFLVGKVAQRHVFRDCPKLRQVLWHQNKYVGLPHPSGRNRQLNNMSDKEIHKFIANGMQQYLDETQAIISRVLEGHDHDP
jgi:uracil-DNA glycosylase